MMTQPVSNAPIEIGTPMGGDLTGDVVERYAQQQFNSLLSRIMQLEEQVKDIEERLWKA